MPDLSQSARNYLEDLTHQPGARAPATLGEIWESEWKRGGLDTITGVGKPLDDAHSDLVTAIETAAGKTIGNYAAEKGVQLGGMRHVDQRIALLNRLADTLPDEAQKGIEPLRDVRKRSMQNAQKIEKDAADVSSATYGLGGTATAWAAGVARQTSDPVNLALMVATAPIGGPITGPAGKFIAGQALGGALAQAAVEPFIEPARAELGLEAGFGRAATNILEAGVGGAVLGGAFVGLHRAFRAAASTYRGERPVDATAQPGAAALTSESPRGATGHPARPDDLVKAMREADDAFDKAGEMTPEVFAAYDRVNDIKIARRHPDLVAEDFEAAALHAERDAVIDGQKPPGIDPTAHAEGVSAASHAMETGRPVEGYHGSPTPFEEFAPDGPYFFSPHRDVAAAYSLISPEQNLARMAGHAVDLSGNQPHVVAADLKMDRPFEASLMDFENAAHARDPNWLRANGYDSAILRDPADPKATEFVVLDRSQIVQRAKSVASPPLQQPELPLPKPIEPKGPPGAVKEPVEVIGDPGLAREVETRLAALGDDAPTFHVEQPDKSLKSGSARTLLKEIEDDAKAVSELIDCIGKEPA